MFFVKSDNKNIPVEDLKIYSKCPVCGKSDEITEDFWEMVFDRDSDFDIYSSQLYCADCTRESNTFRQILSAHVPESQLDRAVMKAMENLHSGITA